MGWAADAEGEYAASKYTGSGDILMITLAEYSECGDGGKTDRLACWHHGIKVNSITFNKY